MGEQVAGNGLDNVLGEFPAAGFEAPPFGVADQIACLLMGFWVDVAGKNTHRVPLHDQAGRCIKMGV